MMVIDWAVLASVATAIGVGIAVVQFWLQLRQGRTSFEDSFAKEYRELIGEMPAKVFFGQELSEEEFHTSIDEFYHYFDLCNEQAFLFRRRRISKQTWRFWKDGIRDNLNKPAFRNAWAYISTHAETDFSELRRELETP